MTLYDSSVLIGYLSGDSEAVDYITTHSDERAVAPPMVLFEVYQGEIFRSESPDFDAVDEALEWLSVIDETTELARAAGELQAELHGRGQLLSARDAFIAGAAYSLGERLVVADADFDISGLTDVVTVDFL